MAHSVDQTPERQGCSHAGSDTSPQRHHSVERIHSRHSTTWPRPRGHRTALLSAASRLSDALHSMRHARRHHGRTCAEGVCSCCSAAGGRQCRAALIVGTMTASSTCRKVRLCLQALDGRSLPAHGRAEQTGGRGRDARLAGRGAGQATVGCACAPHLAAQHAAAQGRRGRW